MKELSNGELVAQLREKLEKLEQDKRDIMDTKPHEIDTLRAVLSQGIMSEFDPYKIKMLFNAAFGTGDSPEAAQMAEFFIMFNKKESEDKRKMRQVYAALTALVLALFSGVSGIELLKIILEAVKIIWGV